jgi:hypothetical protein
MAFKIHAFFDGLVEHLKSRRDDVAQMAVMAAIEHWVQFEAAALLVRNRSQYGISGGEPEDPSWFVSAEHSKLDLWITNSVIGHAVEFKAVHNNKNLKTKAWEIRNDLSKKTKPVGYKGKEPKRWAIAILVYAGYARDHEGNYVCFGGGRNPTTRDKTWSQLDEWLADQDPWFEKAIPVRRAGRRQVVTSLDGAPYIERGQGSDVSLALIAAK